MGKRDVGRKIHKTDRPAGRTAAATADYALVVAPKAIPELQRKYLVVVVNSNLIQHGRRLVLRPVAVAHGNSFDPIKDAHPESQRGAEVVAECSDGMNQSRESYIRNDGGKSQRYRKEAETKVKASHDDLHGGTFGTTPLEDRKSV